MQLLSDVFTLDLGLDQTGWRCHAFCPPRARRFSSLVSILQCS